MDDIDIARSRSRPVVCVCVKLMIKPDNVVVCDRTRHWNDVAQLGPFVAGSFAVPSSG